MLTFHLLNGVDSVIVELVDAEERLLLRHKILLLLCCDCKTGLKN